MGKQFDDFDMYGGFPHQSGKYNKKDYTTVAGKCADTHPVLDLNGAKVYGGACKSPIIDKADVFVGLDEFSMRHHHQTYPWEEGYSFLFPIQDMSVPKDVDQFKSLIGWLADRVAEKKTIHIGCIGGHGRTGMVLAALVKVVLGEEDAITWVRNHYCKKAVETTSQIDFLAKNFGIKKVAESKPASAWVSTTSSKGKSSATPNKSASEYNSIYVERELEDIVPVRIRGSVWKTVV